MDFLTPEAITLALQIVLLGITAAIAVFIRKGQTYRGVFAEQREYAELLANGLAGISPFATRQEALTYVWKQLEGRFPDLDLQSLDHLAGEALVSAEALYSFVFEDDKEETPVEKPSVKALEAEGFGGKP